MGGSGWIIPLEANGDSARAPWSELEDATLQLLWDMWREHLPRGLFQDAWGWVSLGEDSLLTLGDRDQEPDQPVDRLAFWFYLSVDWPVEIAEHWLQLALAVGRAPFEDRLAALGYRLKSPSTYPKLGDSDRRFVCVGDRLGMPSDSGVHWSMPDEGFDPTSALSADALAAVERYTAGGPCDCPFCVRLGLGRSIG